ncbi:VolA/Pla-1 family phospholipase [Vibrio nigripulchritudo]|uniref:VolA/Pla-1 family phospholipase n=1 Tax=Vibrio nigripulchritudo TaxID=28173 RepID=UPI0024924169|nr:VolA/Pla-1 family phospholipase [Vibrio nigripulchritudo]BDU40077.1 lysophospholipase VolA [Vibrio nigripulchritudo]BDU45801.1 lysophospholipase VolA [Vibrio nigripulchritudo]
MSKKFSISLLASALILAGCGNDNQVTGDPTNNLESYLTESINRATTIKFTLQGKDTSVPLPTNLLFNANDGTLNIPNGGDPAITNPKVGMSYADGFSITMPIAITLDGVGFNDGSVTQGVKLYTLTKKLTESGVAIASELTLGTHFAVVTSGNQLVIVPLVPFKEKTEYLFTITDDVVDKKGNAIGTSQSYAALKTSNVTYETGSLASAQKLIKGQELLALSQGTDTKKIVYSSWFTTQSVGDSITPTISLIGQNLSDIGGKWKNSANPNSVDLSTAYTMDLSATATDFAASLNADDNFVKYIADDATDAATKRAAILSAYTANTVNVTKGTVKLPYFLENSASKYGTTPFESATPSLAIVLNALQDDDLKGVVGAQLAAKSIDPAKLATDQAEQAKLFGVDLKKPDGTPLDSTRKITQYSPVPKIKSLESVPFLLFTPASGTVNGLVIYHHGITSAKENAYSFVANIVNNGGANLAVLAIDHPIHGERSISDTISANASALNYLNLGALPVARDNMRQSILDVAGVRAALTKTFSSGGFASTVLSPYDPTTNLPKFMGHSLGGITGFSAVSALNEQPSALATVFGIAAGAYPNAGGQIAELLFGSKHFSPLIKHSLALQSSDIYKAHYASSCTTLAADKIGDCFTSFTDTTEIARLTSETFLPFKYAAQTVIDTIDPYAIADGFTNAASTPTLIYQSKGDDTVPNSVTGLVPGVTFAGTTPLANKLSLTAVTNANAGAQTGNKHLVQYNATAKHSTVIAPQTASGNTFADLAHHSEMQIGLVDFLLDNALGNVNNANGVLE